MSQTRPGLADRYRAVASRTRPDGSREHRMRAVSDALWNEFGEHRPYSWVGFYIDQPGHADDTRLMLGPCRDTPACSPIGRHGVCGQALVERETKIIADVSDLGDAYIACDPRDQSEIVIPLFDADGMCWGVLDIDSWETHAFSEDDAEGLASVLMAAGLTVQSTA